MPTASAERADDNDRAALIEQFREYRRTGDRRLRNELIERNRWIAVHCARRFNNRGEPLDDLIQVAQLGVLKATERFDPEMGVSFTSFAIPTVLGELRRHFRDATWALRVPRRIKDLHVELGPAIEFLSGKLNRRPDLSELAEHLGVGVDDILEAMDAGAAYRAASLAPPSHDDSDTSADDANLGKLDTELGHADARIVVRELLQGLPERERRIVFLRYFEGLSQSEIAEKVGVSQVHVSRLLRASLDRMQQAAGNLTPES